MIKKLNLLPLAVREKQEKRLLLVICALLGGIIAAVLCFQLARIGITKGSIDRTIAKNEKYKAEQQKMQSVKDNIAAYTDYIAAYETAYFPYSQFLSDLEEYRPDNVHIISADTADRLVNEGEADEQKQTDAKEDNAEAEEKPEETPEPETAEETTPGYTKDLAGEVITIRGYGDTQEDISQYIYSLSNLAYIQNAEVTAIEEHKMENGTYNIFEVKLTGGIFH